jgi:ElaB/YqjD/DUF883 family membrane-anchored ribosome-binding protein
MIEREMEQTRTALTEKLEALESKVADTVSSTTDAVEEVVTTTKEAVEEAVENVRETVEAVTDKVQETVHDIGEALSLSHHAERRPWVFFGGAVTVGCLGSWLLARRQRRGQAGQQRSSAEAWSSVAREAPPARQEAEPSPKRSWFGEELRHLRNLAVGALMGAVRDLATRAVPESIRQRVAEEVDHMTTHLGGEPLKGHVLPEQQEAGDGQGHEPNGHQEQEAPQGEERATGQQGRKGNAPARRR